MELSNLVDDERELIKWADRSGGALPGATLDGSGYEDAMQRLTTARPALFNREGTGPRAVFTLTDVGRGAAAQLRRAGT